MADGRWLALGAVVAIATAGLVRRPKGAAAARRFVRPKDALAARQLGIEHANTWADCMLANPVRFLDRMRRGYEIDQIGRGGRKSDPQIEFAGTPIPQSFYDYLRDHARVVLYAEERFPECVGLPLWQELERERGPSFSPYYWDAFEETFAARLAALVTPQDMGWPLESGDPGPVSTPAQGRAWAETGAYPHPLYHATRHGPSILEHGLLTPAQMRERFGKANVGLGFNLGSSFVSLTPYEAGAERLAALHAAVNEAFIHPAEVAGWFFEHLVPLAAKHDPQWRPRQLREVLNRRYIRHPSHVVRFLTTFFTMQKKSSVEREPALLFSAIATPRHPVSSESIGYATVYLHVDRLVVAGNVPPCPIRRGAERSAQITGTDGGVLTGQDADESWASWKRHYGLERGERAASLRSVAIGSEFDPDQGEIRACSEDLTVVGFMPVLDWKRTLHPKNVPGGQR